MGAAGSSGRPSTATRIPRGQAARQVIRASWPAPAMPTSYFSAPAASAGRALAGAVAGTSPRYQPLRRPPGSGAGGRAGVSPCRRMTVEDRGDVRRPAGGRGEHLAELEEVRRAEDPGRRDRQEARVLRPPVDEAVDRAAPDADGLARVDLALLAVDRSRSRRPRGRRPSPRSRRGCAAPGPSLRRDQALEHRRAPVGVLGLDEEADLDRPEADGVLVAAAIDGSRSRNGKGT